ncbi:RnfABCDGE type electron transport complex subunit D [Buchnera aphidicola]|nr:RnfABCDGE type electron transport complex subunit D [Buchnera aphidicola]
MMFPKIYYVSSVRKIMFIVIVACIPGIIAKCYFFGSASLIQIFFSVIVALLLETIVLKIRLKTIRTHLQDNSAILTGVLFGLSIPIVPWWMIIIGMFFAIVIGKHLYGGIGQNIFNPAMLGYAVLLISFPIEMNNWNERNYALFSLNEIQQSLNLIFLKYSIFNIENTNFYLVPDFFTEETPLNNFKIQNHLKHFYQVENNTHLNINIQNSWQYINISFCLGGMFLLFKKVICWRIPISFLSALGSISIISFFYSKELFLSPLIHFFSGGTMICAFFIATDPVTTSCTNLGKIVFGIIIGVLTWVIRNYSDYPDAIAFSVLFANMLVPLIDHCTQTSGYGHKNSSKCT